MAENAKVRLTPMQRTFSRHMADTGDATYAAAKAGYAHPSVRGAENKSDPTVAAEVRRLARDRLRTEGAEVGVRVLIEIASDVKQPAGARVQAADKLVRHAGLSAEGSDGIEPHEMTAEQIARAIGELERAASAQAKPVDARRVDELGAGVFG